MILIVDFGSQTTNLIKRRLTDLGVPAELIQPEDTLSEISNKKNLGIILSGGPASVYEKGAPTLSKKVFNSNIPILGICYGFQLTAKLLGGKVIAGRKEYGPALLKITKNHELITNNLAKQSTVWQSHGDEVVKLPRGFKVLGVTQTVPFAFVANSNKIFGVQFHPEVEHTENGIQILKNFVELCGLKVGEKKFDIDSLKKKIVEQVGDSYVIGAISGGVDSTVAGILTAEAIGKKFIPVYVENGLMRDGTADFVSNIFLKHGIKPTIAKVEEEMLARLKGIKDPERKRKTIGKFYIDIFELEMKKQIKAGRDVRFLMQGTIYSDVIESKGTKHASKIKSHHNVGGLPKDMKLELLEPVRNLYKDEVRKLGKQLGLPSSFVSRQPFPGPGYAVRIRGEITQKRLEQERMADKIILEELERSHVLKNVFQSFAVMTGANSTAVKGDGRFFGEVVAVRIIESKDVMTAHWSNMPYEVLQKISSRIVNEVPNVSRVVYDITTKPPATMEWE